jgi:hypothetical protein
MIGNGHRKKSPTVHATLIRGNSDVPAKDPTPRRQARTLIKLLSLSERNLRLRGLLYEELGTEELPFAAVI